MREHGKVMVVVMMVVVVTMALVMAMMMIMVLAMAVVMAMEMTLAMGQMHTIMHLTLCPPHPPRFPHRLLSSLPSFPLRVQPAASSARSSGSPCASKQVRLFNRKPLSFFKTPSIFILSSIEHCATSPSRSRSIRSR
jgi:hypothetical protein